MGKVVVAGVALLAAPLAALFGLVALIAGTASAAAGPGQALYSPSEDAVADIPVLLLSAYTAQAAACPGLPWQVIAAIGKVESNHGRFGGASVAPDGVVSPPIIGIALNGTNGTAAIRDTDNGVYDRDSIWDRAVGPFQFIPSSWAIYGQDGNRDGVRNPHNIHDAIPAVVAHLCPYGSVTDLEAAIFSYNRSSAYVQLVLEWASRYTGALSSFGAVVAGYALPAPAAYVTTASAIRRHHDYPAIDLAMPVGTPIFAMVDGLVSAANGSTGIYEPGGPGRCGNTVIVSGIDGGRYTYCHLSTIAVAPGDAVIAGQSLGISGGQPGTPGAGNTTGPHLHLGIQVYAQAVCPQPLLLAILRGTPIPPTAAPSNGCTSPGTATSWSTWLDAIRPAIGSNGDDPTATPPSGRQWTLAPTQSVTQTASTYMDIRFGQPPVGGWSAWANAELTLTYIVTDKPTNVPIQVQVCVWRHRAVRFQEESCSSARYLTITTTGRYQVNLGRPRDWWAKNGTFSWGASPSVIRVMHKVNGRLPMTSRCGSYCTRGNIAEYVPISGTVELVFSG